MPTPVTVPVTVRTPDIHIPGPSFSSSGIYIPGVGTMSTESHDIMDSDEATSLVGYVLDNSLVTLSSGPSSSSVSCRSDVATFDAADGAARSDAPVVKKHKTASMNVALQAISTQEGRDRALWELDHDRAANSARAPRNSIWSTWKRMHVAWFGMDEPVLPLTTIKIRALAACFKAGHYASFMNYASRAKAEHMEQFHSHGVHWSEELTVEVRNGARSANRGKGPSKQSYPVDLTKIMVLGVLDSAVVDMGPVGMSDLLVLGSFFLARELEISCAKCAHLTLDYNSKEVTWNMPVSKNDVLALGTYRTWGCVCATTTKYGCPFHSASRHLDRVSLIASRLNCERAILPLFPNPDGQVVSKILVVESITRVMELAGTAITDPEDRPLYGGQSLRTGGAVLLARMGLDTTRIEGMARWNSPMLLYYIRSAPLSTITKEFCLLAKADDNRVLASPRMAVQDNFENCEFMNKLVSRLDKAERDKSELECRIVRLEAENAPKKHIRNCASDIWHLTRDHSAGIQCYTACGWRYTGLPFELRTILPENLTHKQLCGRCMPAHRLLAYVE